MEQTVLILCVTFVVVLLIFWIMTIKKMKAVREALKSLIQVFPISRIVEVILNRGDISKDK